MTFYYKRYFYFIFFKKLILSRFKHVTLYKRYFYFIFKLFLNFWLTYSPTFNLMLLLSSLFIHISRLVFWKSLVQLNWIWLYNNSYQNQIWCESLDLEFEPINFYINYDSSMNQSCIATFTYLKVLFLRKLSTALFSLGTLNCLNMTWVKED